MACWLWREVTKWLSLYCKWQVLKVPTTKRLVALMALIINHYKPQTQSCSSAGLKSDKTSSKSPRGISPLYLGGDARFFGSIKKQPTLRCLFFRNGPESTLLSIVYSSFHIYNHIYICKHNVSQLLHRFLIDTKITSLHIFHRSPALPKHAGVWPSKSRRDKWPTWRNFKYMFNTSVEEMFFLFFF